MLLFTFTGQIFQAILIYSVCGLLTYATGQEYYPNFPGTGYPSPSLSLGDESSQYDLQNKTITNKMQQELELATINSLSMVGI